MNAAKELPVWRSLLYVPVNVEKFVDKAHTRGADVVQLDLEDSVPPSAKDHARTLVAASAQRVRRAGADVVVRINRPIDMAVRDLEASVGPLVDGIAVTKVEGPDHVRLLDELVSELEAKRGLREGHTKFIVMIETPATYFNMPAVAASAARIVAMSIGGEDFASEVGMEPTEETLQLPKQTMIYAAKSAGLMPFGYIASVAGFGDWDGFRRMVRRSRQFGFMGASCIHPGQVPIVNEEYTPSAEEVAFARRIIEEDRKHAAAGRASFAVDGKMIDIPVIRRAETLVRRAEAIAAREAVKKAALGG
ncbi:MAG: CoA ester lyase [Rhodospirillales bacterium]|nr:CoA ester lyase [Rhodospirillales bacterium]